MSRALVHPLAVAIVLLAAAFLRLHDLGHRPMHGDEANQAVKTGILYEKGEYRYDPFEHHGPTLYYLELPVLWLTGAKSFVESREWQYRLLPAIAGILTVLLLFLHRRELPAGALWWAAAFTAISHAMVFYSRYYVQEALFVLFAQLLLFAGWRFLSCGRLHWAVLTGAAAGLLHATKETCVLVFASMIAACIVTALPHRRDPGASDVLRGRAMLAPVVLASGAAVSVLFFSSFFSWWRGPLDSVLTYGQYLHRAEGAGSSAAHDKPFHYYFQTLLYTYRTVGPRWTEAPVLFFAAAGTLSAWWPCKDACAGRGFVRFLTAYAWVLTGLLCLIPYKTPWNLLIFYQPLLLLAGIGVHAITTWPRKRWFAVALQAASLLTLLLLARQTWQGITLYDADVRNPYVYAHTSTALVRMSERIHAIETLRPDLRVDVIKPNGDYWPLPWYLRDIDKVGYWTQFPPRLEADVIVAEPELHPYVAKGLPGPYFIEMYSLRPNLLLNLYIRQELWDRFIQSRVQTAPPGAIDLGKTAPHRRKRPRTY